MKQTPLAAVLVAALSLGSLAFDAAAADPKPAAKPVAKKAPAAKKATAAAAAAAALSPEQISTAERVLTGAIPCELGQTVNLDAVSGQPGWFNLGFKGKKYMMAPEATTTGAVRLEDKKSGLVWIQIANKSMLMNSKAGQRVADDCKHPSQT